MLDLTWQKPSGSQSDSVYPDRCMATYDGNAVPCDNKGPSSVIGLPDRYEISNLGLSASQLQAVRRKYWGADTLATIGEPRLQSIGNYIGLLGGVSVACFVWFHTGFFSGFFVSLSCGLLAYLASLFFLPIQDAFSPVHWLVPTQDWAVFIGLAVFSGAVFISSRGIRQSTVSSQPLRTLPLKALTSLLSGGGVAAAVSVFFFVMTLTLWYAD